MRTLPANFTAESLKQHNTAPWLWLYKIQLEQTQVSTPTAFLCSTDDEVDFLGETFYPFPITHEPIRQDSGGDLPQTSLTFSNATREFIRYLETGEGLVGRAVQITLTHQATRAAGDGISWDFEIKGAIATNEVITLRLEYPEFYRTPMPQDLFTRDRCRFRFKDENTCGYRGTLIGCDKSLNGPDGCTARGADEAAAGNVVLHPARFGAFPALPRNIR